MQNLDEKDFLDSSVNISETSELNLGQIKPGVLAFYMLLHILVCNCYFFLLVLNAEAPHLIVLAALIIFSSVWAARDSVYRGARPGKDFPIHPLLFLALCLGFWLLTFPLYLTYRQWLRMRLGKKANHFPLKR